MLIETTPSLKRLYTMASSSTNKSQVDESIITIVCQDGELHLEATEATAVFLELNYSIPLAQVNYIKAIPTEIMSKIITYCCHHDGEIVKLADPVALFDLIQAACFFRHKNLMDLTFQTLVSMVKRKSVKEIRTNFIINQNYDWNCNKKPSKRPRFSTDCIMRSRDRETFIKPSNFLYVQRSPLVTELLSSMERRTSEFDAAVKLLESKSNKDQFEATKILSYFVVRDQELADRLECHHIMILFQILEQCTQQFIQCSALTILSHVSFIELEMTPEIIQLLVKFVDVSYEDMAHLALFTLTNIAENLPSYIVVILNNDALERVRTVGIRVGRRSGRRSTMDSVVMFLVAVCRSKDLHDFNDLNKVGEALSTLLILIKEKIVAEHHLEHACYALQYLTYGRVLKIEKLELMWLIDFLFDIIRSPPGNNCPYPCYALGVIGNIARWGSSDQIEILTSDCMILEYLGEVIIADSKKIQMEVCQIISNIAARMEGGLLEKITRLWEPLCSLIENGEPVVKLEAAWAVFNGIYGSKFSPSFTLPPTGISPLPRPSRPYRKTMRTIMERMTWIMESE